MANLKVRLTNQAQECADEQEGMLKAWLRSKMTAGLALLAGKLPA